MIPDSFARGQAAVFSQTYTKTDDGAAVTPSSLTVTVKDPAGAVTTYTLGTSPEIAVPSTGTVVFVYGIGPSAAAGYYRVTFKANDGALSAGVQHSKLFIFRVLDAV